MPNPNDVELVRITTQKQGTGIEDLTPITPNLNVFYVVVEGEAGDVLGQSDAPYTLKISALDLDEGVNPNSGQNNFLQFEDNVTVRTDPNAPRFNAANGWPAKEITFTVTLNDIAAVNGHTFEYRALLLAANQVISSITSREFVLQQ